MRAPRIAWLAAAAIFLIAAGWLMSADDKMGEDPAFDEYNFPTHLRTEEWERVEERQRELPPPPPSDGADDEREATTDPVLRALPTGTRSAVVVEANALRHSTLGELFVDCLRDGDDDPFAELQEKTGLDLLEDLDRLAVADDTLVVSGHFGNARWNELFSGGEPEEYGDQGRVWCGGVGDCIGAWKDELLVVGPNTDSITRAIDRIEGRADLEPPIENQQTYGEIYGTVDPEILADLVPDNGGLADKVRQAVRHVRLHADAMDDVALVADLSGDDDAGLTDLGKSLGSALAVARMAARAQGEEELADLLGHARVSTDGGVSIELALPRQLLQKHLEEACRDHHESRARRAPSSGE
jgi:hypothetical protein